jgi:hypothetical protein
MMEWYWIYLIIGVCLYALCFATGRVEADGVLKQHCRAALFFSTVATCINPHFKPYLEQGKE